MASARWLRTSRHLIVSAPMTATTSCRATKRIDTQPAAEGKVHVTPRTHVAMANQPRCAARRPGPGAGQAACSRARSHHRRQGHEFPIVTSSGRDYASCVVNKLDMPRRKSSSKP